MCAGVSFLKKRLWHRCFPVNFAKFLRTHFVTEHLWSTTSGAVQRVTTSDTTSGNEWQQMTSHFNEFSFLPNKEGAYH